MKRHLVAFGLILAACAGPPSKFAGSWEAIHKDFLLPGYEDFRGEVDGTEDGYIVVSYRLPKSIAADRAVDAIVERYHQVNPCYEVTERTGNAVTMRCPGGRERGGFRWDEEYRFLVEPARKRVLMLVVDSVKRPRYGEYIKTLQDVAGRPGE